MLVRELHTVQLQLLTPILGYFYQLLGVGTFMVVFGQMMTSLVHEYWQALLAQGFCVGIGAGCLFVPSVAILPTYFTSRMPVAVGIAAAGSSLGKNFKHTTYMYKSSDLNRWLDLSDHVSTASTSSKTIPMVPDGQHNLTWL